MRATKTTQLVLAMALAALGFACTTDPEARARQAVEKMKESIPDVEAKALAQKVSADDVRKAQEALASAKEFLAEPNGKLDSVTVNAIEAFQRSHGITDDGLLNEATKKALQAQLAQKSN